MFITSLTRESLFRQFSQQDIFEKLGVTISNSLFTSPFRSDKSVTCKLIESNGILLYFDNRPGEASGLSCVGLVMKLKNLSYQESLKYIYILMTEGNTQSYENKEKVALVSSKEKKIIKLNFKDFDKRDLDYWGQYGIGLEVLNKYNVKSVKEVYLKNYKSEWFNARNKEELTYCYLFKDSSCKIYFPEREEYRFISNAICIQGLDQLKEIPKYLVITKSLKDTMVLDTLGIPSVSPQTENIVPTDIIDTFDNTYLFYDSDLAGRKATLKVRQKHPDIPILLIPQKYLVKDISDFVKKYGLAETRRLVGETICKFENNIVYS